jgi:hypothetical protein
VTETQGWLLISAVLLVHLTGTVAQVAAVLYLIALLWGLTESHRKRQDSPPR